MQITINRNMKRILAFLLAATMLLALAACGNNGEPSNNAGPEKSDASAENGTQTTENKILVVYYKKTANPDTQCVHIELADFFNFAQTTSQEQIVHVHRLWCASTNCSCSVISELFDS